MGFGTQPFSVRQLIGAWGEQTLLKYFRDNGQVGMVAVPYGESWGGRKRKQTDAGNRPDLLLVESTEVNALKDRGIEVDREDFLALADQDAKMIEVLEHSLVALEAKFSFRYYAKGKINFIIDEGREDRYRTWLGRTNGVGALIVWFTADKAFITTVARVLKEGTKIERTYEMRGGKSRVKQTYNLPVESTEHFADVTGVELNRTFRPVLKRNSKTGAITSEIEDSPGILENVNLPALRRLSAEARRV